MKKGIKIIIVSSSAAACIAIVLITARKIIAANKLSSTTYTVKSETYENNIDIAGTVSAAQEQTLQALGDGTVVGVYVKKGDKVKKGDLIIQLDDTTQQYNLDKLDYDMATAKVTGSTKEYELMKKQRIALLQNISDRKVVATFDGVIADLDVKPGASLEAKDSVGTLVDISYLTAEVEIAETDVSKLAVKQSVEFTFPACSETVTGYVTGWPAIGEVTTRGATVVNAELRIDNYPETILPNYSFTGKIKISPDQQYLVVEKYAVGYDEGKPFVQIAKTGEKKSVSVKPYTGDYVCITDGLSGGEVLKAQSSAAASGRNKRGPGGMPGGNIGGDHGGGAGGPPPGGM